MPFRLLQAVAERVVRRSRVVVGGPSPDGPGAGGLARRADGRRRPSSRAERGQAAVELVALLPLVAIVLAVAWQVVLAAHAAWSAGVAARAAARAHAVGADPAAAARAHLPRALERGMRVSTRPDGGVVVSLRIPGAVRGLRLGRATAAAHFDPQGG